MAKVIPFKPRTPKPLTAEELSQQVISIDEAVDAIVTGMVCHIVPIWVQRRWPFTILEVMASELRDAMSRNTPSEIRRYQVDAIIEELKPVWREMAENALMF